MIGARQEIVCKKNPRIRIAALAGHFAMTNSHTNFYVDILEVKHNREQAKQAAQLIAMDFNYQQEVDTIVCMDGSYLIGAYLADELCKTDRYTVNSNKEIYIVTPEKEGGAQMIFRDNMQPYIRGKKILILCGSVLTGKNLAKAIECVAYYGGTTVGAAAVFAVKKEVAGVPVRYLFEPDDIPGYDACLHENCSLCASGQKIDGLANSFGYSVVG